MTKRKTDAEVREAVARELACDARVGPGLDVRVDAGIVTLTGNLGSWAQRHAAQDAAHRVVGVAPPVGEADLRKAIRSALERQIEREANDIELEVQDGEVVLRGVVHSWREREAVLGAVKGTQGVRTIQHTIRVDPYS